MASMRALSLLCLLVSLACTKSARSDACPALNAPRSKADAALPETLRLASLKLQAKFIAPNGSTVDYAALRKSAEYRAFVSLTGGLEAFDLTSMTSDDAKKAFWINLYNSLVLHAVVAKDVRGSVLSSKGFFDQSAYRVGGRCFTLEDIEHGILRSNRPPQGRPPIWSPSDPRAAFSTQPFDPRVHFALHCASRGCPPIAFYRAESIDTDLDLAMKNFIHSEVRLEKDGVSVSRIFDWYGTDFSPSLRLYLAARTAPVISKALRADRPIRFHEYDWSLNERR